MPPNRRLHRKICLLGLLITLPGLLARAAQDSELQPLAGDSVLAGQLGALGMVIANEGGRGMSMGTGFLVSSCHVLTAAHVLTIPGEHVKLGATLRFFPEGGSKRPFFERAVLGHVVAAGADFVMTENPGLFDLPGIAQDWALIELEQSLPAVEPFKLLAPGLPIPGNSTFSIVGYPAQGHGERLQAQEHCANRSNVHGNQALPGLVLVDCAVRAGMSGGPLLIDGGNPPVAAGIIVERFEFGQKVLTMAVPSSAFAEQINTAMRNSDLCAVGHPFVFPPAAGGKEASHANAAE